MMWNLDDVEFLRGMSFTWTKIAQLLQISRSTLYRRLNEEGVPNHVSYSDITDEQLDESIENIKQAHPNDGERRGTDVTLPDEV